MALVVESTSTASGGTDQDLVVTKPTGVSVGDLLLIVVGGGSDGGTDEQIDFSCTGFTEGFGFQYDPGGGTSIASVGYLYRIADASDVSASNYTVTTPSRVVGAIAMFRISGWPSGNPIYASASSGTYQDGNLTVADTVSLARVSQQLIIMAGTSMAADGDSGTFSYGTYQITSSDSNPSWTEVIDADYTGQASAPARFFCAYAITSDTSTITQYGFVKTGDSLGVEETTAYGIGIIFDPVDVTGTNALLSVSPTLFAPTASADTNGTSAFLEVSPTIPTQSGRGTTPTNWTNDTKNAATWSNEDKSL